MRPNPIMRRHMPCILTWILFLLPNALFIDFLQAQTPRVELIVERQTKQNVEVTSPQHVFHLGDLVRFRFKSTFDGYLYVMDKSTSGKYILLYPTTEGQDKNYVEHDKEYLIPMAKGEWFRVDNPPGYETIYFMISPARLTKNTTATQPMPAEPPPPDAPAELFPRCDDSIFQARGECVDVSAGARALSKDAPVPSSLPAISEAGSRDITIINKPKTTVIAPNNGENGPFIYEFRLAHK